MKKVLMMPFLQISSGHHQAADALIDCIKEVEPSYEYRKMDIFYYRSKYGEKFVSALYLQTIKALPSFYSWLYRTKACTPRQVETNHLMYETFFYKSMIQLIKQEKPDWIFCTHSLPSYLLNQMKKAGILSVPVVNVYTDFFINNLWGIGNIDFHLVPNRTIQQELIGRGVSHNQIFVTGIPVHPSLNGIEDEQKIRYPYHVLITGGNLGVGSLEQFFEKSALSNKIIYFVLCGKNKRLHGKLSRLKSPNIIPLEYVACRKKMNELYDQMDLVLTKPGGITISECLRKQLPIFLLRALPGQEELNRSYLAKNRLIIGEHQGRNDLGEIEPAILAFLNDQRKLKQHQESISAYLKDQVDLRETLGELFKRKQT